MHRLERQTETGVILMINKMTFQQNIAARPISLIKTTANAPVRRVNLHPPAVSLMISEEAKEIAAQMRTSWNAGEMTYAEKQAFVTEKHGVLIQNADGTFPGLTDEQVNKWLEKIAQREHDLIAIEGTHNLLGTFNFTATNGQHITAMLGVNGDISMSFEGGARGSFQQIDSSTGVQGIDQPTVRMLDFMVQITQNLREIKPPEDNNLYSMEGILENQDGLRALVDSFALIHQNTNGQGHLLPLENALRHLIVNFFDESARVQHMNMPDRDLRSRNEDFTLSESMREEARNQANAFADNFFNNLSRYGIEGAFNNSWASGAS